MRAVASSPVTAWCAYAAIGLIGTVGVVAAACDGSARPGDSQAAPHREPRKPRPPRPAAVDAAAPLPPHQEYPDLGAALTAVLRDKPRVIGVGELHVRTDRPAPATSALARFSGQGLPALASQVSDVVIETGVVDPSCKTAAAATARVEQAMHRPAATKNEIAALFGVTKANSIKAHVMRLGCEDLAAVAPGGGAIEAEKLLDLVTRELDRITRSAIRYRDAHQDGRGIIMVYGGALHNDLYPFKSTKQWSYAESVDEAAGGRYVEVDLISPELVEGVPLYEAADWYPLVARQTDRVTLIEHAPHSYVILLPRS